MKSQPKRIMVIGCCGSGKSTFSKKLNMVLGLDLIHLDQHFWKPNWTESDKTEWCEKVKELANKPEWIIDGNYGGTLDLRLERADMIIYLDVPTYKCLWRITKRIFKYHGKVRPDMPSGCRERFDLGFYHYVLTFNMLRRKQMLKKLAALNGTKQIEVFKNDRQTKEYITRLKHQS